MTKKVSSLYKQWKGWSAARFLHIPTVDKAYFDAELSRAGVAGDRLNVLELGFGNGTFLAYALTREWNICGTEVDEVLLKRAAEQGVVAYPPSADLVAVLGRESIDVVVAFDVLEHLGIDDLQSEMARISALLKPSGKLIARVPSGDSPFSGAMYNGDFTHKTYLGSGKVEQLAIAAGLEIVNFAGAALPLRGVGARRAARRFLVRALRKPINSLLRVLYYDNNRRRVLDPNMVIVLKRSP